MQKRRQERCLHINKQHTQNRVWHKTTTHTVETGLVYVFAIVALHPQDLHVML